jgi:uncharacterized protein (TIGR02001 family)
MRTSITTATALALALFSAPAFAQDVTDPPSDFSLSGSVTAVTDYRFRGLTQTDETAAAQATVNLNHSSGFYAGVFASNIDDDVSLPGYGDVEVDFYAGYAREIASGLTADVGLLYYFYADGTGDTDFFEPYAALSYAIGPVSTKVGVAYAFKGQNGLGGDDNIYVYSDVGVGIPGTPFTLKGHLGYSDGALGGFNLDPLDESYMDWSVGISGTSGPFTLGVSYIDTDISSATGFAGSIGADSAIVGSIGFAF